MGSWGLSLYLPKLQLQASRRASSSSEDQCIGFNPAQPQLFLKDRRSAAPWDIAALIARNDTTTASSDTGASLPGAPGLFAIVAFDSNLVAIVGLWTAV